MSRQNLTANRRAFRRNPKSFLDKVTEAPIEITLSDGVSPEVRLVVDPKTASLANEDELPPGYTANVAWKIEDRNSYEI